MIKPEPQLLYGALQYCASLLSSDRPLMSASPAHSEAIGETGVPAAATPTEGRANGARKTGARRWQAGGVRVGAVEAAAQRSAERAVVGASPAVRIAAAAGAAATAARVVALAAPALGVALSWIRRVRRIQFPVAPLQRAPIRLAEAGQCTAAGARPRVQPGNWVRGCRNEQC